MAASRFRVGWTGIAGTPYLSTYYFDQTTGGTAQEIAADLAAALAGLQSFLTASLDWEIEPEVVNYTSPSVPIGVEIVGGTLAGSGIAPQAMLPPATQGLLQLRTGIFVGAREVRGRSFVPGAVTTASDAGGSPTGSYMNQLNAFGDALIAMGLVVASKKNDLFYEVSDVTTWSEFAVLRSRRD